MSWQTRRARHGVDNDRYDRSVSVIININGDVFNSIESYEPEFRYGNLVSSADALRLGAT